MGSNPTRLGKETTFLPDIRLFGRVGIVVVDDEGDDDGVGLLVRRTFGKPGRSFRQEAAESDVGLDGDPAVGHAAEFQLVLVCLRVGISVRRKNL